MIKILTMCRQGLVRSVALADVLKLHFEPVDVIPIGYFGNTPVTQEMLCKWADFVVVMEQKYLQHIQKEFIPKTFVCEVGPDTYGHSHNPMLIDKCWRWARSMQKVFGMTEHTKKL